MLPVPSKILKYVPADLHVGVEDSKGVVRDGVITYASETRGAGEYGFPVFDSDTVFVEPPFDCPSASLRITARDGTVTVRKIEGKTDNVVFISISLGGKLDGRQG